MMHLMARPGKTVTSTSSAGDFSGREWMSGYIFLARTLSSSDSYRFVVDKLGYLLAVGFHPVPTGFNYLFLIEHSCLEKGIGVWV
jgi:hypothetical protein